MDTVITELYEKTIKAGANVPLFRSIYDLKKPFVVVKKGANVGTVYSHVSDKKGNLFLMFYDAKNKPYYMLYKPAYVDRQNLRSQGVRTNKEIAQEKKEKIKGGQLQKILIPIAAGIAAILIVKSL